MEVKTRHSSRGCGRTGQLSSASHCIECVDATDVWEPPLFMASGTLHSSGAIASAFSRDINSVVPNCPLCTFNFPQV
jgi:hypothetical protein